MLGKQFTLFRSVCVEDRKLTVTEMGLDTEDPVIMSQFLFHESLAAGSVDLLQQVMHELALIPSQDRELWTALLMGEYENV